MLLARLSSKQRILKILKIITRHGSGRSWLGWDNKEEIIFNNKNIENYNKNNINTNNDDNDNTKKEIKIIYGEWENINAQKLIIVNKPSGIPIKDQDPSVDSLERRLLKKLQLHNNEVILFSLYFYIMYIIFIFILFFLILIFYR